MSRADAVAMHDAARAGDQSAREFFARSSKLAPIALFVASRPAKVSSAG
jgi:hypothetical protein